MSSKSSAIQSKNFKKDRIYRDTVAPGNTGKGRPRKRRRYVLKDDLKEGRLDRGLVRTEIDGGFKLWEKRLICSSTEKGT